MSQICCWVHRWCIIFICFPGCSCYWGWYWCQKVLLSTSSCDDVLGGIGGISLGLFWIDWAIRVYDHGVLCLKLLSPRFTSVATGCSCICVFSIDLEELFAWMRRTRWMFSQTCHYHAGWFEIVFFLHFWCWKHIFSSNSIYQFLHFCTDSSCARRKRLLYSSPKTGLVYHNIWRQLAFCCLFCFLSGLQTPRFPLHSGYHFWL